jgi:hypothetical protein
MWKYGLIKVDYPDLWETDEYCELVELYRDNDGNYTSFSKARIKSFKELEEAYADVMSDGVNNWFAENGTFEWNSEEQFWDWKRVT